jgi:hypothetical protein
VTKTFNLMSIIIMRIYEKRKVKQKILKAVDFFCSGGGMSSGMAKFWYKNFSWN